jgi:hypothetical protein
MQAGFKLFMTLPVTHICEKITFVSQRGEKFLKQLTIQLHSYLMELILQCNFRYLNSLDCFMIHCMEWVQRKEGLRLLVLIRWRKNKIIYFYCLFNNNVSGSDYTGSVNNKLERQWKKADVTETEVLSETVWWD